MISNQKLIHLAVAAMFAMGATVVQADPLEQQFFAGTIKCDGVKGDGTKYRPGPLAVHMAIDVWGSITQLSFDVWNRWGPGIDDWYSAEPFGLWSGLPIIDGTIGFFNADVVGGAYSETGQLKGSVDKAGKSKLEGKSFVLKAGLTIKGPGEPVSAECDWKLESTPHGPT